MEEPLHAGAPPKQPTSTRVGFRKYDGGLYDIGLHFTFNFNETDGKGKPFGFVFAEGVKIVLQEVKIHRVGHTPDETAQRVLEDFSQQMGSVHKAMEELERQTEDLHPSNKKERRSSVGKGRGRECSGCMALWNTDNEVMLQGLIKNEDAIFVGLFSMERPDPTGAQGGSRKSTKDDCDVMVWPRTVARFKEGQKLLSFVQGTSTGDKLVTLQKRSDILSATEYATRARDCIREAATEFALFFAEKPVAVELEPGMPSSGEPIPLEPPLVVVQELAQVEAPPPLQLQPQLLPPVEPMKVEAMMQGVEPMQVDSKEVVKEPAVAVTVAVTAAAVSSPAPAPATLPPPAAPATLTPPPAAAPAPAPAVGHQDGDVDMPLAPPVAPTPAPALPPPSAAVPVIVAKPALAVVATPPLPVAVAAPVTTAPQTPAVPAGPAVGAVPNGKQATPTTVTAAVAPTPATVPPPQPPVVEVKVESGGDAADGGAMMDVTETPPAGKARKSVEKAGTAEGNGVKVNGFSAVAKGAGSGGASSSSSSGGSGGDGAASSSGGASSANGVRNGVGQSSKAKGATKAGGKSAKAITGVKRPAAQSDHVEEEKVEAKPAVAAKKEKTPAKEKGKGKQSKAKEVGTEDNDDMLEGEEDGEAEETLQPSAKKAKKGGKEEEATASTKKGRRVIKPRPLTVAMLLEGAVSVEVISEALYIPEIPSGEVVCPPDRSWHRELLSLRECWQQLTEKEMTAKAKTCADVCNCVLDGVREASNAFADDYKRQVFDGRLNLAERATLQATKDMQKSLLAMAATLEDLSAVESLKCSVRAALDVLAPLKADLADAPSKDPNDGMRLAEAIIAFQEARFRLGIINYEKSLKSAAILLKENLSAIQTDYECLASAVAKVSADKVLKDVQEYFKDLVEFYEPELMLPHVVNLAIKDTSMSPKASGSWCIVS